MTPSQISVCHSGISRYLYDPRSHPRKGSVAQLVEQRIENPRVGGSIPSRATSLIINELRGFWRGAKAGETFVICGAMVGAAVELG
jgi:hypothetical protein